MKRRDLRNLQKHENSDMKFTWRLCSCVAAPHQLSHSVPQVPAPSTKTALCSWLHQSVLFTLSSFLLVPVDLSPVPLLLASPWPFAGCSVCLVLLFRPEVMSHIRDGRFIIYCLSGLNHVHKQRNTYHKCPRCLVAQMSFSRCPTRTQCRTTPCLYRP